MQSSPIQWCERASEPAQALVACGSKFRATAREPVQVSVRQCEPVWVMARSGVLAWLGSFNWLRLKKQYA